jgi:hypothetical protein
MGVAGGSVSSVYLGPSRRGLCVGDKHVVAAYVEKRLTEPILLASLAKIVGGTQHSWCPPQIGFSRRLTVSGAGIVRAGISRGPGVGVCAIPVGIGNTIAIAITAAPAARRRLTCTGAFSFLPTLADYTERLISKTALPRRAASGYAAAPTMMAVICLPFPQRGREGDGSTSSRCSQRGEMLQ